jgi:glycosyltransferase involved in cell wall biosynthesis
LAGRESDAATAPSAHLADGARRVATVKVGLVARFLGEPIGLGTYAVNLLRALAAREDEHQYFIYTPTWSDVPSLGSHFRVRRSPVPRRSRASLAAWDLTVPAIAAARDRVDVVHYLHTAFPPVRPGCPVIINLLDAIPWVVPGYRLPLPYDWLDRRAARRADLLLTLSESAREDLECVLGISRSKIRVIPLGGPPLDPEPSSKEPYFLFVGGTERRKNLSAVLDAFSQLDGFELRVVGANTPSPVHDARREQSGVRWLGHVSERELLELYRHATALVFPSRYEGFGLPVLEAMARHTPVITSTSSSLPEVARGAAVLIDPDDVDGLRDAIRRLAADQGLREELAGRGVEVVSSFSWDETARATVAAYEEFATSR